MGNGIESALFRASDAAARHGFTDGLGERRVVAGSAPGEKLEVLQLRPELTSVSSFEFALRERTARLASFQHESYARVRQIDRVRVPDDHLAVVSEHVEGWRLSDILAIARDSQAELDINAALVLLTRLVSAVATLHLHARGVAHGAIAPERVVVTPQAKVVIAEYVLGSALERLEMSRERLWRELRVALPPAAGGSRFDQRADVTQLGAVGLALVLGRPLTDDDYPHCVAGLLTNATESRLGGRQPLSRPLRGWLARALQLDFRNSFQSAVDAKAALEAALAEERSYAPAPIALETFLTSYGCRVGASRTDTASGASEKPRADVPQQSPAVHIPTEIESLRKDDFVNPARDIAVHSPVVGNLATVVEPVPQPATRPVADTVVSEAQATITAESNSPSEGEAVERAGTSTAVSSDYDRGYPGAMETLFGNHGATDDESERDANAAEVDHGATITGNRSFRIAAGVVALVVLCVGGYLVFGRGNGATQPPPTGTLNVESKPAGLVVKIDGKPRGSTPLKIALAPGPHRLELETGGEPRTIPITMTAGAQVSQYIEAGATAPVTGKLQITSDPPGATVIVDGQRKGTAPLLVDGLAAGTHRVDLQSDAGTVQQQVSIEAGATNSLTVPMTKQTGPVSGWMSVSAPFDLQIYEAGRLIGTSQSERVLMTAGRHEIEFGNETLGFRGRDAVVVTAGKTATIKPQLPKGQLNVNAVPWAEVFVDGDRVGETPIGNLALTIGPHEIVFRHPQFGEQRHAVTVTLKAAARVSVDLRK